MVNCSWTFMNCSRMFMNFVHEPFTNVLHLAHERSWIVHETQIGLFFTMNVHECNDMNNSWMFMNKNWGTFMNSLCCDNFISWTIHWHSWTKFTNILHLFIKMIDEHWWMFKNWPVQFVFHSQFMNVHEWCLHSWLGLLKRTVAVSFCTLRVQAAKSAGPKWNIWLRGHQPYCQIRNKATHYQVRILWFRCAIILVLYLFLTFPKQKSDSIIKNIMW